MANGQQSSDDQFDILEHPTLGTLKFPKGMGVDERNASIDYLLNQKQVASKRPATGTFIPVDNPVADAAADEKALKQQQAAKMAQPGYARFVEAAGGDIMSGIAGLAQSVPGVSTITKLIQGDLKGAATSILPGSDIADQVRKIQGMKDADTARQKAGYSPLYRGAAIAGETLGIIDPKEMEKAAAQGDTASVLGHTVAPVMGALLFGKGTEEARGLTSTEKGPSAGGADPLSQAPGTSRGPVFKAIKELRARGFSNAEIEGMDYEARRDALAGVRKPNAAPTRTAETPAAPAPSRAGVPAGDTVSSRPTEAVSGGKASATNQAAAAPVTSQVPSPIVPAPETTAQAGPGGDLRGPVTHTLPSWATRPVPPISSITAPRDPFTGVPTQPAVPAATTQIKGPLRNVTGFPDPLQMSLENAALRQQRPAGFVPEPHQPVNPQEVLDLQHALASQGYKGEVNAENVNELLRRANEIRAVIAPRPDDVGAIREEHRATLEQPGRPEEIASPIQSTQAGITPNDPYYKPEPTERVHASEVEPPDPQPIKETPVAQPKTHNLPPDVQDHLDLMMRLHKLMLEAETPEARETAKAQWEIVGKKAKSLLRAHAESLSPEQRQTLYDEQKAKEGQHNKQAGKIDDIIVGHPLSKAIRREMAPGQPVVSHPEQTTQFSKTTGKPIRITGTTKNIIREALHNALDDKISMEWDEINLEQRARARKEGIDPDSIQPEGYRLMPPVEYQAQKVEAIKETKELQDRLIGGLRTILTERIADAKLRLGREPNEEEVKAIHDQALKELLAEKNEKGETIVQQVEKLHKFIGRSPQRPVYVRKGEPVIEGGVVGSGAPVPSMTLKIWNAITGKKNNKIGSPAEWKAEADKHKEMGRLHGSIAAFVKTFLDIKPPKGKEGGAIGEFIASANARQIPPRKMPSNAKLIENANKYGAGGWEITDDKPSGSQGWLSPDGKIFIDNGRTQHHSSASSAMGPENYGTAGDSYATFMENGFIRKAGPHEYDVEKLDSDSVDTIEMDQIRHRTVGEPMWIDYGHDTPGLEIPANWNDLGKAIAQAKSNYRRQIGSGGTMLTTGMAVGGVAGAVAGHVMGGVHGMFVGGTLGTALGFMTPVLLSTKPMKMAMKTMAGIVKGAGITLKNWMQGPPQRDLSGLDPDMDDILREQKMHQDRSIVWSERARQLPAQLYRSFDQFAYVADKNNMPFTGRVLMMFDPQGKAFRDLKLPDTQSLYVALANAGGDALSGRRYMNQEHDVVRSDANTLGLRGALDRYLNYKGYQRTNEVLQEHIQDLATEAKATQVKLQDPKLTDRQRLALEDRLKDAQRMQKEIQYKVDQGLATPKEYTPAKIAAGLAALEQELGPQDFARVKALADRAFATELPILDMMHDTGMVSDEAYQLFKNRGPEYIPMERIMDDLENNRFVSGTRPIHLRHQTVIQRMEGSVRTNVSPWEAFDHYNGKAYSQFYRNDAARKLVDLAKNHPQTIGLDVTPVKEGYVPKAGEMIIGHYQNGRPDLYAVPTYLGEAMTGMPVATTAGLSVFANWMQQAFTRGATVASLSFQAASLVGHALSGMVLSPHGAWPTPLSVAKFWRDWLKATKDVINKSQHLRELTRLGGLAGTLQQHVDPNYFASPSELGWKGMLAKRQIIDLAQDIAHSMNAVNHVNIFKRAVEAGVPPKQAAFESKQFASMPDASRMGDLSKSMNKFFMFYKMGLQYQHQWSAALRKQPLKVFAWIAAFTGAALGNAYWNSLQVDSHGNNLLRKESVFQRDRNWIMELPFTYHTHAGAEKGWSIVIPKPPFFRNLNPIEDAANYAFGKEARTGKQQAIDAIAGLSPIHMNVRAEHPLATGVQSAVSDIHPLAKLGVEQFANIDDYGRPIVPPKQEGTDIQFQEGPYTSAVAERMGQGGVKGAVAGGAFGATLGAPFGTLGTVAGGALGAGIGASGVSPRRIDVGANTLAAATSRQAEGLLDPFFGGKESRKSLEGPEYIRNLPVVGPIVGRFLGGPSDAEFNELSTRFYDVFEEANKVQTSYQYLLDQGKGPEAARYLQANKPRLHMALVLASLIPGMNNLNSAISMLQGRPDANSDQVRSSIEKLYESRMMLLRTAKNMIDAQPTKASDTGPMGNVISNTSPSK